MYQGQFGKIASLKPRKSVFFFRLGPCFSDSPYLKSTFSKLTRQLLIMSQSFILSLKHNGSARHFSNLLIIHVSNGQRDF